MGVRRGSVLDERVMCECGGERVRMCVSVSKCVCVCVCVSERMLCVCVCVCVRACVTSILRGGGVSGRSSGGGSASGSGSGSGSEGSSSSGSGSEVVVVVVMCGGRKEEGRATHFQPQSHQSHPTPTRQRRRHPDHRRRHPRRTLLDLACQRRPVPRSPLGAQPHTHWRDFLCPWCIRPLPLVGQDLIDAASSVEISRLYVPLIRPPTPPCYSVGSSE